MTKLQKITTQLDYILLDASGSMSSKWWDALDSIDAYVGTLQAKNVNSQIILSTFESANPEFIHRDQNIAEWKPLRDNPIGADFTGTPLYDAVHIMARKLRDLDPPRASLVIVTDGQDTGSKTDVNQAKSMLDWCRAKGWQVTFIGAGFDNSAQAKRLGSHGSAAIGVSPARLIDAAVALGEKRARYGLTGDEMHFTDDERQQFGGFLAAPEAK